MYMYVQIPYRTFEHAQEDGMQLSWYGHQLTLGDDVLLLSAGALLRAVARDGRDSTSFFNLTLLSSEKPNIL